MTRLQRFCLLIVGAALLVALPVANAEIGGSAPDRAVSLALPTSAWWLVIHNQCARHPALDQPVRRICLDPTPWLPNEAPSIRAAIEPLHIRKMGAFSRRDRHAEQWARGARVLRSPDGGVAPSL